jgi:predicted TIM-barrel fold metal-dependent hydrolase
MALVIDGFAHVMPRQLCEAMLAAYPTNELKGLSALTYMGNMEKRVRAMDKYKVDKQILTLARPSIWINMPDDLTFAMTRLANDAVAEAARQHADRLIPVATLPVPAHGDSVLSGAVHAFECGYKFFGPQHIVFATDYPFGPREGEARMADALREVATVNLPEREKELILSGNLLGIIHKQ